MCIYIYTYIYIYMMMDTYISPPSFCNIRLKCLPWLAINKCKRCHRNVGTAVLKETHSEWEGQAAVARILISYCTQSSLWRLAQRTWERQNSLIQIMRAEIVMAMSDGAEKKNVRSEKVRQQLREYLYLIARNVRFGARHNAKENVWACRHILYISYLY